MRRIQEVFTDPKPGTFPEKVHQGDPPPNPVYITATRGEFIWAPGGGAPGYVDELICQITPLNAPQYVLQDANYNAVALVDLAGTVLSQFTYDPYGEPIIAEQGINGTASQVMDLRVGHQGLFLDRLNLLGNGALDESGASGSNWTIAAPTGGLGNRALYQNRNRTYSPSLGRFVQRDPNGGGQDLVHSGLHASRSGFALSCVAAEKIFADGINLYAYVRCTPVNGTDAVGLESYMGQMHVSAVQGEMISAVGADGLGYYSASIAAETGMGSWAAGAGGGYIIPGLGGTFGGSSLGGSIALRVLGVAGGTAAILAGSVGVNWALAFAAESSSGGGRRYPHGFSSAIQYNQAMAELEAAAAQAGLQAPSAGVRGSAVTGRSSRTNEPFGNYPGRSRPSDIDAFLETSSVTSGMHPRDAHRRYPQLKDWSLRWSRELGYKTSVKLWPVGGVRGPRM